MAYFFGDGFDCYRDLADCSTYWDATLGPTASLALSASGRFAGSRGLINVSASSTPYLAKTSGVNDAVHHVSVAFQQTSALGGTNGCLFFTFYDGATAQCTVVFRSDGAILLVAGAVNSGTTLATYVGAVPAANIWYQFEIEVVIHNTTGSISVRRNGNTSNDFSLGSLNTRASANNYANKLGHGVQAITHIQNIDDFLWRSDASSVAWIGDVRCYTRMPAADSAVQFTRSGSVVPVTPYIGGVGFSSSANSARYTPFYATCSGTITSAIIVLGSGYTGTGNMKAAIFTDAGGAPGTSLGSATVATITQGNNTATFGSPPSVTQGTKYWLGLVVDTAANPGWILTGNTSGAMYGFQAAATAVNAPSYASFPTNNPSLNFTTGATQIFTLNITPTTAVNANLVAEIAQDAAAGYVLSSTNGQADLYTLQAASPPPATIIGVTTRGLFQKSDVGTRNATVQLKSGGTTVAGTSTALPVGSWQWIARNDLVDPATSAAWTASAVNAALVGPAVTV